AARGRKPPPQRGARTHACRAETRLDSLENPPAQAAASRVTLYPWASSLRAPQFSSSVVRRSACPLVSALVLGRKHRPTSAERSLGAARRSACATLAPMGRPTSAADFHHDRWAEGLW